VELVLNGCLSGLIRSLNVVQCDVQPIPFLERWMMATKTKTKTGHYESISWFDASKELPDSGMEVIVCFERNDCEERDTCIAVYDDSIEGGWWVDGSLTHFGVVLFWADKPTGPQR
jgi:hypothetical protein